MNPMIASIVIFVIVYILIASEKVQKTVAALLGASAVVLLGLLDFESAMKTIDLNVIFLLIGMMTCVAILAETGFFEWVAISVAKGMKGNASGILIMLLLVTMICSAFLDNVTTVILLAPVTILITQLLELPTIPFLILEALASNIGGTATLIGDPPNIIIGSRAELSFMDFIQNLTPGVLILAVVFIATSWLILRKYLHVTDAIRVRVTDSCPKLALRDVKKMKRSLSIFGLIFAGFFLHHHLHVPPGIIALGGMALMLLVCYSKSEDMLRVVEWDAILFFIGLFIVIGALEHNGVIDLMADAMLKFCGDNLLLTTMVILWGSAFLSAVLDNIPFVIVMLPLLQKMIVENGGSPTGDNPLFWALALGACLGGNGTIIGASANVVVAKIGERNGYHITFWQFMKWGMPLMVQSIFIAMLYLWIRYF
ncbi:MAG: ArsB/NhaD family transporter [Pontiellaceae bacterium]|jgi:Na+/H+ antiporter NhaD/arsenite permease-like protein|nr:ArsB/NhaD family transporter [Pontiellaceae bacterium]